VLAHLAEWKKFEENSKTFLHLRQPARTPKADQMCKEYMYWSWVVEAVVVHILNAAAQVVMLKKLLMLPVLRQCQLLLVVPALVEFILDIAQAAELPVLALLYQRRAATVPTATYSTTVAVVD
jgi:hypothetical protein